MQQSRFTRLLATWGVLLMSTLATVATWALFVREPAPDIGMGAATAYGALLGTGLAGAWAFFRWARGDTNAHNHQGNRDYGGAPWRGG